ncbi:MAG: LuxR C-terminal-related transcriptional regulator [Chloroflexaceae bacterium]|jgi:DNA-binding CsgD family transcriptional regulator|nr:LuxR C-terminal-related transcriptional regulator [Chloroflexaceae bacterium]
MISPYIISNWVEGDHFYGRESLCDGLLASADRCVYLAGTRRVGKTSLLRRLKLLLHPHGLYCDLMQAADHVAGQDVLDEGRAVRLLRRELSRQSEHSPVLAATRDSWDRQDGSLGAWLEEASWVWETHGLNMTLLWDEGEMLRRLPNAALMRLRAVLQQSRSLRLILTASKGLAALNDRWRGDDVSPFLFGFRSYALAGLDDAAAAALVTCRGSVAAPPEVVSRICTATGNHPFLLQTLCDRLYSNGTLRTPTGGDLLADLMLADLFRIDVAQLSPSEQALLLALACHGPAASATLAERSKLPLEAVQRFASGMAQLGYLRASAEGTWQVGNEFLAGWTRSNPLPTAPAVSDQASLEVVGGLANGAATPALAEALSERELAVLRLLVAGMRNGEIASQLTVSENTIKAHLKHIYRKLGVNDRLQAANRARALKLL